MEYIKDIINLFLIVFVLASVSMSLYPPKQKLNFAISIWRNFRIKMLFEVILLVLLTLTIFMFLYKYIPISRWGWLNLFVSGGGNVMITPILSERNSSNLFFRLLVPIFFFIFILAIPSLANAEEYIFRRGYTEWRDILEQSVKFGFIHLIVGIPLSAAIALIGVGFFCGYKYRKTFFDHYNCITV